MVCADFKMNDKYSVRKERQAIGLKLEFLKSIHS